MSNEPTQSDDGSFFLSAIQAVAISPEDATSLINGYRKQVEKLNLSEDDARGKISELIVSRYSNMAASCGAATGLVGAIPGLGTAVSIIGGSTADIIATMKLQTDMCMCLAANYDHDLHSQDAQHLSFIIAISGALEQAAKETVVQFGSRAGVRLVRQYLKGAALIFIKQLLKRLGIVFTRKALEKAIPFGIGAIIGGGTNYALTRHVGKRAIEYFTVDLQMRREGDI